MRWARAGHLWLSWLFLTALVVQFFLAGAGAFGAGAGWERHEELGNLLLAVAVVMLVLAAIGRVFIRSTAALAVALLVQFFLATAAEDASPWLAALHGVNALVIVGVAHVIASRARRTRYAPPDAPSPSL